MTLDLLLKPVRFIDTLIHRKYEWLGSKLDDKLPKARYFAASVFYLTAFTSFVNISVSKSIKGVILGVDAHLNMHAFSYGFKSQEDTSVTSVKEIPIIDFYLKINKAVRSPLFLTGVSFFGKGAYDVANALLNNEPVLEESYSFMSDGLAMLGISSSIFLKDKTPKILNKDSFWTRAYSWARNKFDSMTPELLPEPTSAVAGLENYI